MTVYHLDTIKKKDILTYNKFKDKLPWVIYYHSQNCGYCLEFNSIWKQFVKNVKINTIKIDYKLVNTINPNHSVNSVPKILFINKKKKVSKEFNSERNLKNLLTFCKTKTKGSNKKYKQNKLSKKKITQKGSGVLDMIETKLQTLESLVGTNSFE